MTDAFIQSLREQTSLMFAGGPAGCAHESITLRAASRSFARAAFIALLIFLCAEGALGVSLSDYHGRVRRALVSIGSIGARVEGEYRDLERERSVEGAAIREMRRLLPADETVEWQGGTLRVDNTWLANTLDDYERLPEDDSRRVDLMARIAERLQAIDDRLTEIEGAASKTINKDEEKARLAEILRREDFNRQQAEGNALTRLLKRFREWLRSFFPRRQANQTQRDNQTVNGAAQVIVALLALAVILYVAWRFLPRFLQRERRKRKPKKRGARVVLGEQLSEDESSADLLTEAERLALSGDMRAAIRKGYMALLCELHDRKLVRLEQHKTNRDYLSAVQSNRPLYEEMKPMTTSFENHWYGFTPATDTDWQSFRAHYRKAIQQ